MSKLTQSSPCDNVCLEHQLALELASRGLIERVAVVQTDDEMLAAEAAAAADCFVDSIDAKLAKHLQRVGLGGAQQRRTPRSTLEEIFQLGATAVGSGAAAAAPLSSDVDAAVNRLDALLRRELGCTPRFEVCVSYRAGVADDEQQANELCRLLHGNGVRAVAVAASLAAAGVLKTKPRIFVAIESRASLTPLTALEANSAVDAVAVEWSVAAALQEAKAIDFLFPVLLGDTVAGGGENRQGASLWGEGSSHVVPDVDAAVAALLPSAAAGRSSKELLGQINQNQGQKVGGWKQNAQGVWENQFPEHTLAAAARQIREMGSAVSLEQVRCFVWASCPFFFSAAASRAFVFVVVGRRVLHFCFQHVVSLPGGRAPDAGAQDRCGTAGAHRRNPERRIGAERQSARRERQSARREGQSARRAPGAVAAASERG
jgi:hypothetical protein